MPIEQTKNRIRMTALMTALFLFFQFSFAIVACQQFTIDPAELSVENILANSLCSTGDSDQNSDSKNSDKGMHCNYCMNHNAMEQPQTLTFSFEAQALEDSAYAVQQQKAHKAATRGKSSRAPPVAV